MPRYVILLHEMPDDAQRNTHWDFMLEDDGVLRTWALSMEPRSGQVVAAEVLADHRLAYLDHEGPISGGRGNVTNWDTGTYSTLKRTPTEWDVALSGRGLSGRVKICRIDGQSHRWRVAFEGD